MNGTGRIEWGLTKTDRGIEYVLDVEYRLTEAGFDFDVTVIEVVDWRDRDHGFSLQVDVDDAERLAAHIEQEIGESDALRETLQAACEEDLEQQREAA